MTVTWQSWPLAELERLNRGTEKPFHVFLDVPSMSAELFELPAGAKDTQQPHEWDEFYHIAVGKAKFIVDGATIDVRQGQSLFVKAGIEHRFFEITEDLQIFVCFSKMPTEKNGR